MSGGKISVKTDLKPLFFKYARKRPKFQQKRTKIHSFSCFRGKIPAKPNHRSFIFHICGGKIPAKAKGNFNFIMYMYYEIVKQTIKYRHWSPGIHLGIHLGSTTTNIKVCWWNGEKRWALAYTWAFSPCKGACCLYLGAFRLCEGAFGLSVDFFSFFFLSENGQNAPSQTGPQKFHSGIRWIWAQLIAI